jgi:hypothetical protein
MTVNEVIAHNESNNKRGSHAVETSINANNNLIMMTEIQTLIASTCIALDETMKTI